MFRRVAVRFWHTGAALAVGEKMRNSMHRKLCIMSILPRFQPLRDKVKLYASNAA